MKKNLIIGDLHFNEHREKAINLAIQEVVGFTQLRHGMGYKHVIFLGDIFNKYPTMKERLMFAKFISFFHKISDQIILIKGTDSHDYYQQIYTLEDIVELTSLKAVEEIELYKYTFGHFEIKGAKYSNGYLSQSTKKVDSKNKYVLGHCHLPQKIKNVLYLGSLYKTSFAERDEQKRIAIIEGGKLKIHNIKSRPMYQIDLIGKEGKVKCPQLKLLQELKKEAEIDLKIVAETDSQTIGSIHRNIEKIKSKFNIEYYKEEIKMVEIKTSIPDNLNQEELLRKYCSDKKVEYKLVTKELK